MATSGLNPNSSIDGFIKVVESQNVKIDQLSAEIHVLKTSQGLLGGIGGNDRALRGSLKNLTDLKGITMLDSFDGSERHFKDWFTKLRNFVQHHLHFELYLKKIMEMENEAVFETVRDMAETEKRDFPGLEALLCASPLLV